MDILVPDDWLREYLKTKANPQTIKEKLSLCGPSVEKISTKGNDTVYSIEITTNRVDTACVYGIAREAAAILPRFGIKARLKKPHTNRRLRKGQLTLKIKPDPKHVKRVMGTVIKNIDNKKTPEKIKQRLISSGLRSKNPAVDITNYVMLETGHPTHVFDYDKIKNGGLFFRLSHKGEKVTSFEGKTYTLLGGDLVIVNNKDEIVDVPGIIGAKNSAVDKNTKNVLFFIDNNDPKLIRKTSMELAIRTYAASLNEKGVDPELAEEAMKKGLSLFESICKPKSISPVYDWHPSPYKGKEVSANLEFINQKIGVKLTKTDINKYLKPLSFKTSWDNNTLLVKVPSFRERDINIEEDIVEEIARMHGYFDLPSDLPLAIAGDFEEDPLFELEKKIKQVLCGLDGHEVYTLSMTSKQKAGKKALRLKNPLGKESEYLRTTLKSSLKEAVMQNPSEPKFFMFEIANIYLPQAKNLPQEKPYLGLIFKGYDFREAKGVLEALLGKLNMNFEWKVDKNKSYLSSIALAIFSGKTALGNLGKINSELIYAQIELDKVKRHARQFPKYKAKSKFPPQIEDFTIKLKPGQYLGPLINQIENLDQKIAKVELVDIYKQNYTLRIYFQATNKTLETKTLKTIRNKIIKNLGSALVQK